MVFQNAIWASFRGRLLPVMGELFVKFRRPYSFW